MNKSTIRRRRHITSPINSRHKMMNNQPKSNGFPEKLVFFFQFKSQTFLFSCFSFRAGAKQRWSITNKHQHTRGGGGGRGRGLAVAVCRRFFLRMNKCFNRTLGLQNGCTRWRWRRRTLSLPLSRPTLLANHQRHTTALSSSSHQQSGNKVETKDERWDLGNGNTLFPNS